MYHCSLCECVVHSLVTHSYDTWPRIFTPSRSPLLRGAPWAPWLLDAASRRAAGSGSAGRRGRTSAGRVGWRRRASVCGPSTYTACTYLFLWRLFAMATIMVAAPLRRGKRQQRTRCRRKSNRLGRRIRGSGGARSGCVGPGASRMPLAHSGLLSLHFTPERVTRDT